MGEGLEFRAVTHRFLGSTSRPALRRFDLVCRPGEVTALVGANGAGKSTALALAAGLVRASEGSVRFRAQEVAPPEVLPGTAYLPERPGVSPLLTVAEVLSFACAARGASQQARTNVCSVAGLREVENRRVGHLSSGWRRRVGLAVALLEPTELLLFDEPFVGLDLATLERVVEALRQRAQGGATVVVASHEFEVLDQLANTLVVLDDGRLLARFDSSASSCRALFALATQKAVQEGQDAQEEAAP